MEPVITVAKWGKVCPMRQEAFKFALLIGTVICGPRLFRGEDAKSPWPFKGGNWMFSNTKGELEKNAEQLRKYLKARSAISTKKKKGESADA